MTRATIRNASILAAALLFAVPACDKGPKGQASAPAPSAAKPSESAPVAAKAEGKQYGAGVTAADTVSIADLVKNPEAYEGKTVKVEGTVTDVCVKRGCWINIAGEAPGEKAYFKVTDGEMIFPVDSKGQWAVAEGKVVTTKMTVEEARAEAAHLAKESGKDFDPASITEGSVSFRIQGTGAVIGDKK